MELTITDAHGLDGTKMYIEAILAMKEQNTATSLDHVLRNARLTNKEKVFVAFAIGKIAGVAETIRAPRAALDALAVAMEHRELSEEQLRAGFK